jgi:hypothetical protein
MRPSSGVLVSIHGFSEARAKDILRQPNAGTAAGAFYLIKSRPLTVALRMPFTPRALREPSGTNGFSEARRREGHPSAT